MEIYHTLNRGVDKRVIFLDDQDRLRFVHDLFEFNNQSLVNNTHWTFKKSSRINDIASRSIEKMSRKLLVDIHAFCLMPNHYHLLLTPRINDGISKFMKKLNIGYAKYFNQKYKRTGALFEGRYKSISISGDAHFGYIPYYIHFNPLDLVVPEWRDKKIFDYKKAKDFLENYRWSSHLDYIGIKNFPSLTNRKILLEYFEGNNKYQSSIETYLKELNLNNIKTLSLE